MKAISTFVAAIMLIAFTVAAGVLLSTWFTTYTSTTTAGVGGQTEAAMRCPGALKIIFIKNDITRNKTVLMVQNTKSEVSLTLLSVLNSTGDILNNSQTSITLTPTEILWNNTLGVGDWVKVIAKCEYKGSITHLTATCRKGENCWLL